nr:reverse transcriptase domain-containing protein [Tanacetum cinerariifolium]
MYNLTYINEIDLSLSPDDSISPCIEDNDYDFEGDILVLEELLNNDSLSLPENESFHFDIPSSPRPLAKPPDDDEIEPNSGILTVKVDNDYEFEGDILVLEELLNNDSLSLPENESFHFDIPSSPRPLAKPPDDDEIEPNSGILTVKVCMCTKNSYFPNNSTATILRRRNKRRTPNVGEHELRTIIEMAYNRTMEELLQAPTKGYGEAIVILEINADHFEIKTNLLQLVQANPYHGFQRENPHTHINNFKRITLTLEYRDVPNEVIKLMMFPYALEGNARFWYDKEPPNSILTWEDLVNKFVNQFFHPSKTTHLKNEISRFTQRFEKTFGEACKRFKEILRAYPHHGFMVLAQIDTFYNGLNDNDQESLNAATGGNLLSKTTREALQIIENKSKVHY